MGSNSITSAVPPERPPLDLAARERQTEQIRLRLIALGFVAKAKEKA